MAALDEGEWRAEAWLVKGCPNFHCLPSDRYDRILFVWDDHSKDCASFWKEKGFEVVPLVSTNERDAEYWLCNESYGIFTGEGADAARFLGKSVMPVRAVPFAATAASKAYP